MGKFCLFCLAFSVILASCETKKSSSTPAAITIDEKTLIPEGIVVDTVTSDIYLTSINERKIVRVDVKGQAHDFTTFAKTGFGQGLGIKIDYLQQQLLAVCNVKQDSVTLSSLFIFDLPTGKKVGSIHLNGDHFLNDLVITKKGWVYITDSNHDHIYEKNPQADSLSIFVANKAIQYSNGISLSSKEDAIYMATWKNGIVKINRTTKSILDINSNDSINDRGIDGLVTYNQSLIGVQNAFQSKANHRVVQYHLDESKNVITNESIIDLNNPNFDIPTTAAMHGNILYIIANSQVDNFNGEESKIIDSTLLRSIVVLRYPL